MKTRSLTIQWLPLFFLFALLVIAGCSPQEQQLDTGELVIPGTGACQDLLRQLAAGFNATGPDFKVVIPDTTGSNGGIQSVQDKEAVLGRVARSLRPEEKNTGLELLPFAKDAIVFAVGAKVPQTEFTVEQLAAIFAGQTVSWQLEDGSSQPIRVIGRQEGDSSLTLIRRHLSPFAALKFAPDTKIVHHDPEMVELLNKYTYSIGFLSRSSLLGPERRFHAVALTGLPLTVEGIKSSDYPMASEYAFVSREGKTSGEATKFINFIKSQKGRAIIEAGGMIPFGGPP